MTEDQTRIVDEFFSSRTLQKFKKGDVILRAGEASPCIYYLKKGLIRQYVISKRGDVLVIHIFKPGSIILLLWALYSNNNAYYFDAVTPVEVNCAAPRDVEEFMKKHSDILFQFTKRLLKGVSGLLTRVEALVLDPAYVKVSSLISYFARTFGEPEKDNIALKVPLPHREIAAWIGTTRETASLQIEELKRKGLIEYQGRTLIVKDLEKLEREAVTEREPLLTHILLPLQTQKETL